MYDTIVIGGGPAGMSASLNLKIRNKDFILLGGTEKITGLMKAPQVDNYLGFSDITGSNLISEFSSHINRMNIEFKNKKVNNILNMGESFLINSGNEFFESKSVIIAIGHSKPNYINGERQYLGKGVGYCATCDGPLYRNKAIAIISENEEGEEEAAFLSEICSKVYYIPKYSLKKENDKYILINKKPIEILGNGDKVIGLSFEDDKIDVDGVFIIRDVLPAEQLIEGLEMDEGAIKVNRNMQTSINGVFACGDCIGKPYQIAKAVGEGCVAALSAVKYLDNR